MPRFRPCLIILAAILGVAAGLARAGMNEDTKYTEKGQADFDTFLQLLNPYGTWSKIDGLWAYTPLDHLPPYTSGRWIYTEYGWMWKGTRPHSWATEHYGYWKRGDDKVWRWFPGPFWLPETIEIRGTPDYIGWRSAQVDDEGSFVEAPIDRYVKFDEWSFVTLAQFANPVTPSVLAKPDVARVQLEASTDCRHSYFTYREIDRPGPHPADIARFIKTPGMLAPMTMAEEAAALAPKPAAVPDAGTNYAAHMTGTNAPTLLGSTADPNVDPNADLRKVKYWVTMSLPTFWSKPPDDARADQIYLYRPDMYQDQDGIERRITLWFNPNARTSLSEVLNESPSTGKPSAIKPAGSALPAVPVAPADADTEAAPGSNPFTSPLDQPFHEGKVSNDAGNASNSPATNAPPKAPAPSGMKSQ
ncbi:MAG TPA: DUF6600 domain-containing protein [Candidatus Methylacidiphilales bacterium]|nr:DUF6600 domain-containing protein [Candidatus Methylacidiphilales bacterium]